MASIEQISGIGPAYGEKLRALGITTTEALLNASATPQGRQELAEKIGVSMVANWIEQARGLGRAVSY